MTYERIDWNQRWKENFPEKPREENLKFWNEFAPRFRKKVPQGEADPYAETFYEYSGFLPGETIFDMGCGSGTLAIPFAKKGHEIYAADFSPEMLKYLMEGAEEKGVSDRIHPILLDWNEDWSARADLPLCGTAISSRAFYPRNLSDAISKLQSVASRRVCIGAWDQPMGEYDRGAAVAIGYEPPSYGCYVYVINELMDRGLRPEMRFIKSPSRTLRYETPEQAIERQLNAFSGGLTQQQEKKLRAYCAEHLVLCEDSGAQYWKFDRKETGGIAHISWAIEPE